MEFLARRALGLDVSFSTLESIHWVFDSYMKEVARLIKILHNLKSTVRVSHRGGNNLPNKSVYVPLSTIVSDSWKSMGYNISSKNVRVLSSSGFDFNANGSSCAFKASGANLYNRSLRSKLKVNTSTYCRKVKKILKQSTSWRSSASRSIYGKSFVLFLNNNSYGVDIFLWF